MVKGRDDPVYRRLAFQLTEALGIPNLDFKKSREELSTFIIEDLVKECTGSGFLLENVGIVTNAHTVEGITQENSAMYNVFRYDEEKQKKKCNLIAYSKTHDLAILEPHDDFKDITPYKIGDDKHIRTGYPVTVVGFPGFVECSGSTPFIAKGHVTSKRKLFGIEAWLVDVPINHGCSGGPVLNERHEVIGVATFGSENNDGTTEVNGFISISKLNEIMSAHNS